MPSIPGALLFFNMFRAGAISLSTIHRFIKNGDKWCNWWNAVCIISAVIQKGLEIGPKFLHGDRYIIEILRLVSSPINKLPEFARVIYFSSLCNKIVAWRFFFLVSDLYALLSCQKCRYSTVFSGSIWSSLALFLKHLFAIVHSSSNHLLHGNLFLADWQCCFLSFNWLLDQACEIMHTIISRSVLKIDFKYLMAYIFC